MLLFLLSITRSFWRGVGNTMLIALIGTVVGLLIGLLTGVVRTAPFPQTVFCVRCHGLLNGIIAVYVEVFRGTPMMVQAMVIYWGYAFATGGQTLPLIPSGNPDRFHQYRCLYGRDCPRRYHFASTPANMRALCPSA